MSNPRTWDDIMDSVVMRHRLEEVRRFPDTCAVGVTRKDEYEPCDKPAVAAWTNLFDGEWHTDPVCAYHAHMLPKHNGALVPLAVLLSDAP